MCQTSVVCHSSTSLSSNKIYTPDSFTIIFSAFLQKFWELPCIVIVGLLTALLNFNWGRIQAFTFMPIPSFLLFTLCLSFFLELEH